MNGMTGSRSQRPSASSRSTLGTAPDRSPPIRTSEPRSGRERRPGRTFRDAHPGSLAASGYLTRILWCQCIHPRAHGRRGVAGRCADERERRRPGEEGSKSDSQKTIGAGT